MERKSPKVDRSIQGNQLSNYSALMGTSFSGGEHKYNQWHQDRLLQMVVKPNQFKDLPNE
jgi:hypothetical protein